MQKITTPYGNMTEKEHDLKKSIVQMNISTNNTIFHIYSTYDKHTYAM